MANPEHLAILKQGVEVWNKWRTENPEIIPELKEASIQDIDLSGAFLSQANLSKAYFNKVNLIRSDLYSANLNNTNFYEVDLSHSNLNQANLNKSYLFQINLSGVNLNNATLIRANLMFANLINANINDSKLGEANLSGAMLSGAKLVKSDLTRANLSGANFTDVDLSNTTLSGANLLGAKMIRANLTGSNLRYTNLIYTDLSGAILTNCKIYGTSVWDVNFENTKQDGLIITQVGQPFITVDNLEMAQFIYLLLNNSKLRTIINTVANKAVLILGRFGERKVVLDSIADELRKRDYLPIMFDFDRPLDKTLTETVLTLAGLSKFVIAVMSDPKSVPHEAASIIPIFKIPFIPLIQEDQQVYSMFDDFKLNPWFIPPIQYKDSDHIKQLMESLLLTAEGKHKELRKLKSK
jgi:uncharacterized protein YjbI with pentapeptide repeats